MTVKTIRFMVQRLCQIKPDLAKGLTISVAGNRVTTNSDEINRVLSLGQYSYIDNGGQASPPFPIVLGKNSFIYLNPKTNKLTLDTSGPAHVSKLSALAAVPDGQQLAKIKVDSGQSWDSNYNIFMGVTNAYGSHNIHDQMFRTWGSDSSGSNYQGGSVATDTLTVSASSGATGGMLGMVKFEEYTSGGMNVALGGGTNLTNRN